MRFGTILLTAGVLVPSATAPGCLGNACLMSTCDGPYCRCTLSTCGEGAAFDNRIGRCRCLPDRVLVGGHCLGPQMANAYCGPGYHWANDGCYPDLVCRAGDELDQSTGRCMPREQVNQVAGNRGIIVGPGQKLGCAPGQKLVIDGQNIACVPLEQTCARDETWNGQACAKAATPTCTEGSTWDAAQGRCVAFAKENPAQGLAVNVGAWATSSYGPDGGNGAPAFCTAFTRKPWSFGVNEGSSAMVRVAVTLTFAQQEIARGTVQTRTLFAQSGNPVPQKGAAEVDAAARAALTPLVGQGGRASAPTVITTVRCQIVNAERPVPVPATGGL